MGVFKGTNEGKMACNLFHYFPIQFIVAVTVTVWQAFSVLVAVVAYRRRECVNES